MSGPQPIVQTVYVTLPLLSCMRDSPICWKKPLGRMPSMWITILGVSLKSSQSSLASNNRRCKSQCYRSCGFPLYPSTICSANHRTCSTHMASLPCDRKHNCPTPGNPHIAAVVSSTRRSHHIKVIRKEIARRFRAEARSLTKSRKANTEPIGPPPASNLMMHLPPNVDLNYPPGMKGLHPLRHFLWDAKLL